jgi:hypothetical protein
MLRAELRSARVSHGIASRVKRAVLFSADN